MININKSAQSYYLILIRFLQKPKDRTWNFLIKMEKISNLYKAERQETNQNIAQIKKK